MRSRCCIIAMGVAAVAPPAAAEPLDVRGRAELVAAGTYEAVADDGRTRFTLDRAEAGATATLDRARAELVLEAVRSAGPDSFAGIDGNSILVRVKRASLGGRHTARGVTVGADLGLVADPWIAALGDYPLRALGVAVVEDTALVASSDLGLAVTARYRDRAQLALAITNGEGAHQVERNDGKDTSAVATVWPGLGLALQLYGRDGSIGPGATRSHRAGAAITWHHRRAAAGADVVHAWGVGERPDVLALAVEAWAEVRAIDRAGVSARWDRVAFDGPTQDLVRWRGTGAVWYELAPQIRVLAALQLERAGGAAIAGVPGATDATRLSLVVQGALEGTP